METQRIKLYVVNAKKHFTTQTTDKKFAQTASNALVNTEWKEVQSE